MYHRIIVPLDGTPFSEYAIPFAASIAERAGATLELCHVHVHHDRNPDFAALTPFQYQNCVEAEYAFDAAHEAREGEYLAAVAERVRQTTTAVVTSRMLTGRVEGAIRHEAETAVADLLVMSTHARSGFARVRLGSVADALVHSLSMPILLVQPGETAAPPSFDGFRRALVTLDGSPFSEQVLHQALPLLATTGARPLLLHVLAPMLGPPRRTGGPEDPRTIQRRQDAIAYLNVQAGVLAQHGLESEVRVVVDRNPAAAILELAAADDVDLLAMATHGRGGLSRLVMGSVADEVMRQCRKPILLYRPRPVAMPHAELQEAFTIYGP